MLVFLNPPPPLRSLTMKKMMLSKRDRLQQSFSSAKKSMSFTNEPKRIEWVSLVVDVAIMPVAISRDSSRVFESSSRLARFAHSPSLPGETVSFCRVLVFVFVFVLAKSVKAVRRRTRHRTHSAVMK